MSEYIRQRLFDATDVSIYRKFTLVKLGIIQTFCRNTILAILHILQS